MPAAIVTPAQPRPGAGGNAAAAGLSLAATFERLGLGFSPGELKCPPGWLGLVNDTATWVASVRPPGTRFDTVRLHETAARGRLRWLFNLDPVETDGHPLDAVLALVVNAEECSSHLCSVCGSPAGPVFHGADVMTLCSGHATAFRAGRSRSDLYALAWEDGTAQTLVTEAAQRVAPLIRPHVLHWPDKHDGIIASQASALAIGGQVSAVEKTPRAPQE